MSKHNKNIDPGSVYPYVRKDDGDITPEFELKFKELVERITDAFVSLDKDWNYTYVNKKAGELFGRDAEDLIGKNIWAEFPEGIGQPFYHAYYMAMETQQTQYITEYYQPWNKWYENHIYPSKDGLSIIFNDITSQKKISEKITTANERFETITKATNDALWEWDMKTGHKWGNEAFYKLYGLDPLTGDLNTLVPYARTHPDDVEKLKSAFKEAVKEKKPELKIEYRFKMPEGNYNIIIDRALIEYDESAEPTRFLGAMMDITDRKNYEYALQESEDKARIYYDHSAVLIWEEDFSETKKYLQAILDTGVTDLKKYLNENHDKLIQATALVKVLSVNNASLRFYSAKDFDELVTFLPSWFTEESWPVFADELDSLMKGDLFYENEITVKTPEGDLKHLVINISVPEQYANSMEKVLVSFVDITALNKTERELETSEDKFRDLVSAAPVLIFQTDINGNCNFVNTEWLKKTGLLYKEAMGKGWIKAIHPQDKGRVLTEWQDAVVTNTEFTSEFRFLHKEGQVFWLSVKAVYLVNANNKNYGYIGIATDITEKLEADKKLEENELRCRILVEQASDAILIVDKSLRYIEVNKMAVTMLGYSREEFLDLSVKDITVLDNGDVPLRFTDLQNDRTIIQEREFKRKDGSIFPVEISAGLLSDGNYLAIVRDIAERKRLEKVISGEKQVLEMIARGDNLEDILNTIAVNYESIAQSAICSILLLDADSTHIKKGLGPNLPAAYNKAIEGEPVGPAAGSCGTAAYRKERVIVADIASDPLWISYRNLALKYDLRACWSSPIINDGKVLGTFAIYYNEVRLPTEADFKLIDRAASQVKIALVRHYSEIRIKENETKFSKVFHNPGYAYAILDAERKYLDLNHSFEELIEYNREELIGKTSAEAGMNSLEFVQQRDDLVFKLMTEGKLENIEIEFESRTKKEKTILLSVHAINLNESNHWLLSLVDITEKKKAEKALISSEEKYRTLVEQASDAIFIADSSGRMLTVNKSACKLAECTEAELLQMSIYDFVIPENLEKDPFHFDELKTGKTVINERIMRTKSNRVLHIEVTAKFLSNGRLFVFIRDISKRKKAEQLLKENEQRLTRAENMGNLGHGFYDIVSNSMHISEGLYKIFGVNPEEFSHTVEGLKNTIHPDDYPVMDRAVDTMFKDGEVEVEFRIVQPRGEIRIVLFKTILTKNNQNELISSFTTALDITERKKTATERQALLLRNEQIITTMLDGFILADEKGNIIEVNPAYCKMTGYRRDELLQMNINQIETSLSEKEIDHRIKEMIEHKSLKFETMHCRKDKTMIDLEVSVSIMITDEQPLVAAFVRDITEKKKVQQQIENYNNQLSQLTAHLQSIREEERRRIGREIHDDLGQQLTAIKMDVAWIDKKTVDDSSLVKQKLKNIISLLDGSNVSVRRILSELKPSILDEYGLMDALDLQAKKFTDNTGIPLKIVSDQKAIQLAEDIATCIFRVFQESLTNITRYAQAKKVFASLKISDAKITASIEDDGIGFETSVLQTKNSFGILGMHERVRALAGHFEIQSTVGKGTTVTIILPLKNNKRTKKRLP